MSVYHPSLSVINRHPATIQPVSDFVLRFSGQRPVLVPFDCAQDKLVFSNSLSTPRVNLGANRDWVCLALNWVCFFADPKRENLHNILSYRYLRSFRPFANWVCFFKLTTKKHQKPTQNWLFLYFFCIILVFFFYISQFTTYYIQNTIYEFVIYYTNLNA